ncbi:plasmid partition protein [Streptomyces sp. DSM 44938]|uniref:Plasmid partition protein n=2 Tax=Streptomyces litchfieldiae TaxID=3075543 RepID=A0ABU2N0T1_9ACTN|nr:plasmid partition protein [Streptomyces sp. DSM 44938]
MLIANIAPRSMGKTTDTGWTLHALYEAEAPDGTKKYKPRGYDSDHSRQLHTWATGPGEFPMPVELAASARFHREVHPPEGWISVVDCGHTENHPDITDSVLRVADLVILHLTPSTADIQRVVDPPVGVPIADMVARSAALRPDGTAPPAWALLNRVVPPRMEAGVKREAKSTVDARDWLESEGWKVLDTTIRTVEDFKQSIGQPITDASSTEFGDLIRELENRGLLK